MKYVIIFLVCLMSGALAMPKRANDDPDPELEQALAEEIKEYHFHLYFFQDNDQSNTSAEILRERVMHLVDVGFFNPVPGNLDDYPIGPHVIGQFYTWCPKEYFSRTYSWFALNRGNHSVLIHPLTTEQLLDHTDRVAFLGPSVPLDTSILTPVLDHVPLEHPELGLGYSANNTCTICSDSDTQNYKTDIQNYKKDPRAVV